ncbi:hypothetical protein JBE04_19095 [Streptomyces sp. PRKS01-29]|nr:hypothetical protein [Streptomyces sabulosicollis]MBI0296512.1 hypothetical protein [Streptomyces sabulosicollis]
MTDRRHKEPSLNPKQRKFATSTGVFCLVLAVSTTLTGCSQEKRNYQLPATFCGIHEKKSLYAPIFPPGDKLKQNSLRALKGVEESERCDYYIDGYVKITVNGDWYDKMLTPQPTLESLIAEHGNYKPKKVSGKHSAATWPYGAVSLVKCPNSEYRANLYSLTIYSDAIKDRDESHRVLGDLIQSFTSKVLKILPCEDKATTAAH